MKSSRFSSVNYITFCAKQSLRRSKQSQFPKSDVIHMSINSDNFHCQQSHMSRPSVRKLTKQLNVKRYRDREPSRLPIKKIPASTDVFRTLCHGCGLVRLDQTFTQRCLNVIGTFFFFVIHKRWKNLVILRLNYKWYAIYSLNIVTTLTERSHFTYFTNVNRMLSELWNGIFLNIVTTL